MTNSDMIIPSNISALDWLIPAMWAVGILLPALGILGVVLFNVIHRRLISLGHENRELHQRIDRVYLMVVDIQKSYKCE